MKRVFLFKAANDGAQEYVDALKYGGFEPVLIPTLAFSPTNAAALQTALRNPQAYSGLILTSPRAVEVVAAQYAGVASEQREVWRTKKVFCVGESSRKAINEKLNLTAIGSHTGNGKQLAQFIVENTEPFNEPLLFPSSNLKRDEIPKLLAAKDRNFSALTAYETSREPGLAPCLRRHLDQGAAHAMVFFSPSGVEFAGAALRELGVVLSGVALLALGPSTTEALVGAGLPVAGVCQAPAPHHLLAALRNL